MKPDLRSVRLAAAAAAAGLTTALLLGVGGAQPYDPDPAPAAEQQVGEVADLRPESGEQALEWLAAGNQRFRDGHLRHRHESMSRVAMLSEGQHPFGIVLGCADSRVAPELVFDHGLGDLFVIRVAGNVVAEDEAGSIEYALQHLGVPLLVVLGHDNCGAVTAALGAHEDEPGELVSLLRRILPALGGIDPSLPMQERIRLGVEANVRQSVAQLRAIQDRLGQSAAERTLIVGAVYDLETGRVRAVEEVVDS